MCDYSDQYKEIIRLNSCFCYLANTGLIHLGGKLKHNEYLSGKLADMFISLYACYSIMVYYENKKNKEAI